jgi:glucokinase
MADHVIGVDIGGTNIKAGVVDYQGNVIAKQRALTEAKLGSDRLLNTILNLVIELKKQTPQASLKAAGFGVPGAIKFREGIVTQAPNIPSLNGLSFRKILEDRLEIPCYVDNDANLIAAGEMWVGAGTGYQNICALALGTGIGGGVIIDGEILRGADGMAAELGHVPVNADGPRCNCGSYGCLEMYSSATGILRMVREALERNVSTPLASVPFNSITPETVYRFAKEGDRVSHEILESAGTNLGVGLAAFVNIFNPEIFIIGGGVAASWDLLMPPALAKMRARAFKAPAARVEVVRAKLEDEAGICGSAYLAWDFLRRGDIGVPHERRFTPWGFWEVLEVGRSYQVKRICIYPGNRLSYQRHQKREETWMIASGEAKVMLDDKDLVLRAGETIHIQKTQAHRIGNLGDELLVFFEVQRGSYFGEDDIERLQDDYHRP